RERIRRFFSELSVGEDVLLSALGKAILEVNGVENYVFTSMSDTAITNADMGKLGTLTVNEMQGG
ncbi:MAG: phage tail protein, partial [Clostridia bacterium]|nr:phage tail protein [Clostridia bacterium]